MKLKLLFSFILITLFFEAGAQFIKDLGIKTGIAITNHKHLLTTPDYLTHFAAIGS